MIINMPYLLKCHIAPKSPYLLSLLTASWWTSWSARGHRFPYWSYSSSHHSASLNITHPILRRFTLYILVLFKTLISFYSPFFITTDPIKFKAKILAIPEIIYQWYCLFSTFLVRFYEFLELLDFLLVVVDFILTEGYFSLKL